MAKRDSDSELEDEFETATKKARTKKAEAEDDDEAPAPKAKKRKAAPVEEEDDEPAPAKRAKKKVIEEEDDEPAPRKKTAKRKAVEEDEDDDEKPKKKRGGFGNREVSPETKALQARILKLVATKDSITNIELAKKLDVTTLKSQQLANGLIRKGKLKDKRDRETGRVTFVAVD